VHLARDLEIGVSASAANDPANEAVLGLSARWSAPTEANRTVPWKGVDARVLHPEDLEGRELAALAVPDKFTIVAMVADWCGVCRAVRPDLEQFARRRPVALRFVDIDENPEVAARYSVRVVPTYFILDTHARIVLRMNGINWKALDGVVPP
jgi:thiol-disulfide isomerase/thioredoxin